MCSLDQIQQQIDSDTFWGFSNNSEKKIADEVWNFPTIIKFSANELNWNKWKCFDEEKLDK